jgi:TRAP-type C4-dicarboxylate transport system substrate-binding protein
MRSFFGEQWMRFPTTLTVLGMVCVLSVLTIGVAQAATFKIATIAPEGSQWMLDLRSAADKIKQESDGRVTIKFYGGGVMGNDKKVLRKIRAGQLHGGVFTANGLAERYPEIVLYGLPMVFRSQDEVDHVRAQMDPVLAAGLLEAGFVSFGFAGGGFAKLMGNEPITRLEDLRGRKVWVPEGDRISYKAMEAIRLSPVVLPITDVLTALQTGLLEYIATPPVGAVVLQWYTKVSYVTVFPFAYTLGAMVIEAREFSKLELADQEIVRSHFTDVYTKFEESNKTDNLKAEEALIANGLKFVELDATMVPKWTALVAESNRKLGDEGAFSIELLDQMLGYLDEFRNGAGSNQAAVSAAE